MPQPTGTFARANGEYVSLSSDSVETRSVPGRWARILLRSVGIFVALATVGLRGGQPHHRDPFRRLKAVSAKLKQLHAAHSSGDLR